MVTVAMTKKPLNPEPVCMAVWEACEGKLPFGEIGSRPLRPVLADMALTTFALFQFAGERGDKRSNCVGCRKLTNRAWHVAPINTTVPACNGDCLIRAVEKLWNRNGWSMVHVKRGEPVRRILRATTVGGVK